jgi:hypothetical protein
MACLTEDVNQWVHAFPAPLSALSESVLINLIKLQQAIHIPTISNTDTSTAHETSNKAIDTKNNDNKSEEDDNDNDHVDGDEVRGAIISPHMQQLLRQVVYLLHHLSFSFSVIGLKYYSYDFSCNVSIITGNGFETDVN